MTTLTTAPRWRVSDGPQFRRCCSCQTHHPNDGVQAPPARELRRRRPFHQLAVTRKTRSSSCSRAPSDRRGPNRREPQRERRAAQAQRSRSQQSPVRDETQHLWSACGRKNAQCASRVEGDRRPRLAQSEPRSRAGWRADGLAWTIRRCAVKLRPGSPFHMRRTERLHKVEPAGRDLSRAARNPAFRRCSRQVWARHGLRTGGLRLATADSPRKNRHADVVEGSPQLQTHFKCRHVD
jgi:hypothetical protein